MYGTSAKTATEELTINYQKTEDQGKFSFSESFSNYRKRQMMTSEPTNTSRSFYGARNERFSFVSAAAQYCQKELARQSPAVFNQDSTSRFTKLNFPTVNLHPNNEIQTFTPPVTYNRFERDVVFDDNTCESAGIIPNKIRTLRRFLNDMFHKIRTYKVLNVNRVWTEIKKMEQEFNVRPSKATLCRIELLYQKIHVIFFAKYGFLEGKACMKTLKFWNERLTMEQPDALVAEYILNEIKNSYFYVFGSAKKDINYQIWIDKINRQTQKGMDLKTITKNYMFFKQMSDGLEFKILHTLYEKIQSRKGNFEKNVKLFQKKFKVFQKLHNIRMNQHSYCKE